MLLSGFHHPRVSGVCEGGAGQRASVRYAISLCVCYAMSGTDVAYGVIGLRTCCVVPGTNAAYGATSLHRCSAMSGTDVGYGATAEWRPPTLSSRSIPKTRQTPLSCCALATRCPEECYGVATVLRACYAMSGTDLGDAGTRKVVGVLGIAHAAVVNAVLRSTDHCCTNTNRSTDLDPYLVCNQVGQDITERKDAEVVKARVAQELQ
eukprot:382159-Rhodomonas_salina.1